MAALGTLRRTKGSTLMTLDCFVVAIISVR